MTSSIYKITNIINNKVYIGKTTNPNRRWNSHKNCYSKYKNRYLYRAMSKYGVDNFVFEVIHCDIPNDEIDYYEKKYIVDFNCKAPNGYNMTDGGEGSVGRAMSELTKAKLLEVNANRVCSDETRKKMSDNMKKRYSDQRVRDEQSAKMKGHKKISNKAYIEMWKNKSEEDKQKLTEASRKATIVPIVMLDIETLEEIMSFDSMNSAVLWIRENTKYEKAGHQNIGKACRGSINYVYGYKWKYK